MNLDQVKVAVGFDVQIIRGTIHFLYEQGRIPSTVTPPGGNVEIALNQPNIEVDDPSGNPELVLRLTGSVSLGALPGTEFDARIALEPFVRPVPGMSPVAALQVREVLEVTPANLEFIFSAIATDFLDDVLENMDLPLFDSFIEQLESAFFPGGGAPSRDQWAADFYLGKVSQLEHVDVGFPPGHPDQPQVDASTQLPTVPALMTTLALPGESAAFPNAASIVPTGTGIQILIARPTMDALLGAQAASQVGADVEGTTINRLSMQMHELGIAISGEAEKSPATIEWDGILLIFFRKRFVRTTSGTIRWHPGFVSVFASGINVDVDIPWWVTFLRVLGGIFLGPIYWILDSTLVQPKLDEADEAPDIIRSVFQDQVGDALRSMLVNVGGLGDASEAPLMTFGHDTWVLNGHYTMSLLAFAGINSTVITNVEHDTFEVEGASGQSVGLLSLGTGHVLHPEEAGRLLKAEILRIPDHHGVEAPYGYYVRSNPNEITSDNLVDPELILVD